VSNYYWSGDESSKAVFDCMISLIGKPDYTFLLYANEFAIKKRLIKRDEKDHDINKTPLIAEAYHKMESFLIDNAMKYRLIDTTDLNANKVVEKILKCLSEIKLK
jgi:broad-specificity NMP kinase